MSQPGGQVGAVAYTVRATFSDGAVVDEYVAWLVGGHCAQVIAAGALDARIIRLDASEAGASGSVEVRYTFASREEVARYVAGPAVRLRAEGEARFGSTRGVSLTRTIGTIVFDLTSH